MLVRNFSSVVFILASSMVDGWKDLSVGGRIASKLVGHELPRWPTLLFQDLAKEALGGPLVSAAGDQDVEDITVLIHGSPKIMTLSANGDEYFVHVPDVTETALPPPQSAGVFGSKLAAPGSNGFVGHLDATLGKKVLDVSKAQREPMV